MKIDTKIFLGFRSVVWMFSMMWFRSLLQWVCEKCVFMIDSSLYFYLVFKYQTCFQSVNKTQYSSLKKNHRWYNISVVSLRHQWDGKSNFWSHVIVHSYIFWGFEWSIRLNSDLMRILYTIDFNLRFSIWTEINVYRRNPAADKLSDRWIIPRDLTSIQKFNLSDLIKSCF